MKLCSSCKKTFSSTDWVCPRCHFSPVKVGDFFSFAPEMAANNENFPADGFDRLIRLEAGNFWFRSRSKVIIWAFRKHFKDANNFVEIGCGNGYVLSCVSEALPHLKLYGGEGYTHGLEYAAKRVPAAEFFQLDARSMPFQDHFDVIGSFDVLEHIEEDEKVLSSFCNSVVPGGGIIITVPQHEFLHTYADDFSGHVRRYSAKELKDKVERAGFKVEEMTSFVSLLLPLMLLSRLLQGNDPKKYDPEGEFHLPRAVNYILEKILDLERGLIRLGLRMPWGGSLLLVARKN